MNPAPSGSRPSSKSNTHIECQSKTIMSLQIHEYLFTCSLMRIALYLRSVRSSEYIDRCWISSEAWISVLSRRLYSDIKNSSLEVAVMKIEFTS